MSLGKYQEASDHIHAFKAKYRETNPERPFVNLDLVEAINLAFLGNPDKIMELDELNKNLHLVAHRL